jgi:UDP-N-acetylmuramyl pentapeptide phosphotransferase/UDP-N-acetylglucosamine-1-phosphate transferase
MWKNYDLPSFVMIEGEKFNINTDWRNIIDIFECFNDKELTLYEKFDCVLDMFYENYEQIQNGEKAIEYLAGKKTIYVYRGIWVILVFVGAVVDLSLVWNIADGTNALMAIPNLISLLLLSGVVVAETRKYLWNNRLDEYDHSEIPEIDD